MVRVAHIFDFLTFHHCLSFCTFYFLPPSILFVWISQYFQIPGNLSNPTMSFRVPFILNCNHLWKATSVFICVRAVSSQFAYACFFRLLCVTFVPFSFHFYFFLVIVSIVCPSINSICFSSYYGQLFLSLKFIYNITL